MAKAKDLTGMKFGIWTVLKLKENRNGKHYWLCECSCDTKSTKVIDRQLLMSGNPRGCNCEKAMSLTKSQEKRLKNNIFTEKETHYEGVTPNGIFYFDKEDYDKIVSLQRCWHINNVGYVVAKHNNERMKLHNYIMNPQSDYLVDHIDGNPLNNRRCNLRICKYTDNSKNKKIASNNTSGVKGVSWSKQHTQWLSYIGCDNKKIYLGLYQNYEDAVRVRKEAEKIYFGEFNRKEHGN